MNMKLVHFSERFLNDYYNLSQKGIVRLPDSQANASSKRGFGGLSGSIRTANFMQTEDSQKNRLRDEFQRLSAAKMIVDGIIVPNLTIDQLNSGSIEGQYYTLTIVTSKNKLYQVDFQVYFLQAKNNLEVKGPFQLNLLGTATSCDLLRGKSLLGRYEYVIGTTVSDYQHRGEFERDSLFFVSGDATGPGGFEARHLSSDTASKPFTAQIADQVKGIKNNFVNYLNPANLLPSSATRAS